MVPSIQSLKTLLTRDHRTIKNRSLFSAMKDGAVERGIDHDLC